MLDLSHGAGEVPILSIAANDNSSASVLPIDGVCAGTFPDVGQLTQFNLTSIFRQVNPQASEIGVIRAIAFFQSHEQIESSLAFQHLRHHFALQRRLYNLSDIGSRHTVKRQIIGSQSDVQLFRLADGLNDRRRQSRHGLQSLFHLF